MSLPEEEKLTNTSEGSPSRRNINSTHPPPPRKPLVEWSTGLFDCCSDPEKCCKTFWCPCITFGQLAEISDQGSTSCCGNGSVYMLFCCMCGHGGLYSCFYRSEIRQQYNLKGSDCLDFLIHCCCEACALSQEYRELENHGFNLVTGWHGNVEQQTKGITMATTTAPTVESSMDR
ncbi:protein PLANT CADMIUM RESISTANCE 2-like [Vicia villosa]|uniref:protein PLANT CADMIUM RESISTANCE 2-like n=1 Tax=Vicia villosa TaxID=3911 RepID=UPI00273C9435|nr:protein PLANT CADMIUM RESISTANCE 2-like [Vicia villosa]